MKTGDRVGKIARYLAALWLILSLNFFLIHLMPGDPLVHLLGEESYAYLQSHNPQQLASLKAEYGLDLPLLMQYFRYLESMLQGQLGWSYQYGRPVLDVIIRRLGRTLLLMLPSLAVAAVIGVILGCFCGWIKGRRLDRFLTPLLLAIYAVPVYCLGFFSLFLAGGCMDMPAMGGMAEQAKWGGSVIDGLLRQMALPSIVLLIHFTAYDYVIMRNSVRQVAAESFVLNAMARGLPDRTILFRHVLVNALLPFITVAAMQVGLLFGGALLVEVVFSWPGMGTLIYEAVRARDYPLLSGCFVVVSVCAVAANAAADILYAVVDPRVKDGMANP